MFSPEHALAATTYTITDLGPAGGISNEADSVNASGQVAVTVNVLTTVKQQGGYDVFLSSANGGTLHGLGSLGGYISYAAGVNANGQVVGVSQTSTGASHAFISDANGGAVHDLGTFPGDTTSYANGINDSGQVVGYSALDHTLVHAFISAPGGGALHSLHGFPGSSEDFATSINNNGQVVGYSQILGLFHAVIWDANTNTPRDLGTLGGSQSHAYGINASGQVVGSADTSSGQTYAFISDPNGGALHDLGGLGGFSSSAEAVNDSAQVVGTSSTGVAQHAFLYSGGQMYDLNSLIPSSSGVTLLNARAINDLGQIAATGQIATGATHAFLLTPTTPLCTSGCGPTGTTTPELGSGDLLATGLLPLGLAFLLRRRRAMQQKRLP